MRNLERKFAITDTNGAGVDVGPTESSKEAPKAMVISWSSPGHPLVVITAIHRPSLQTVQHSLV